MASGLKPLDMRTSPNDHGRIERPFLRWAGGKQRLVHSLLQSLPVNHGRYFEPFLGAGSLFFASSFTDCALSDANECLIRAFMAVRDRPDLVSRYLNDYVRRDSQDEYYRIRKAPRNSRFAEAARFIYLNRAAHSGIYRVNRRGEFNVPYGPGRTGLKAPAPSALRQVSSTLSSRASLIACRDFRQVLDEVAAGDFVYLDPPYIESSATAFFRHYTPDRFDRASQSKALSLVNDLDRAGCGVMITIRLTEDARRELRHYRQRVLESAQWLSYHNRSSRLPTLLVTNY